MNNAVWKAELEELRDQHADCLYDIAASAVDYLARDEACAQEKFRCLLTQVPLPRYAKDEVPERFFDIDEALVNPETDFRLASTINQVVRELILKNVTEDEFYAELWRRFSDTILIPDAAQRAVFLLRLWLDVRIPYYQLGPGITMPNEQYHQLVKQLEPQRRKVSFILNAGYPQKTQKASILMKVAGELSSDEERAVFWSIVLGRLENRIRDLQAALNERGAEE